MWFWASCPEGLTAEGPVDQKTELIRVLAALKSLSYGSYLVATMESSLNNENGDHIKVYKISFRICIFKYV
jgi:hypothetical protein